MRKLFSLLLVMLMLLSPFAMCVNAESVAEQAINTSDLSVSKITPDLQAHLDTIDDDEYVPVYVWLNDYGEDMLYEVLSKRVGKTVTADTEEAYIKEKIDIKEKLLSKGLENLAKTNEYKLQSMSQGVMDIRNLTGNTFKAQANLSSIMTDEEIDTCIESNMTSTEIIELSERNQFLSDYRQSRKTVNTAVNNTFYNSLDLDECRNIYLDPLLCRVTMECKKSYVDNIENLSIVSQVGIYEEVEFIEEEIEVSENSRSSTLQGYHMYPQNTVDGTTYTGAGIRVGVLEPNYFDATAPHLSGKTIVSYSQTPSGAKTDHGTKVMSILAGIPLPYSTGTLNATYQGIAPDATLYFAGGASVASEFQGENSGFVSRLEWLIDSKNCQIINISMGVNDGNYTDYDNYLDQLVLTYNVVIVKSAGNNEADISRPGMSYNSITVGNVTNLVITEEDQYTVEEDSSYEEASYLTNKPDVSAFGTEVIMLDADGSQHSFSTGTSFAAPQVAGAAALMMQANPYLTIRPNTVKAILMSCADESVIAGALPNETSESNPIISTATSQILDSNAIQSTTSVLRERSGAGLLDIEASIRTAKGSMFYSVLMSNEDFVSNVYDFVPGTTIEFGLVYQKNTDDILEDNYPVNVDIQIINSSGNVVFESTDDTNNAEIFKCTFDGSYPEQYRFKAKLNENSIDAGDFWLSMFVLCGCKEKNIVKEETGLGAHILSCDIEDGGCGFRTFENHFTIDLIDKQLPNGATVSCMISYLPNKETVLVDVECFRVYFWLYNPTQLEMEIVDETPDDFSKQYISGGETWKITYAILITENGTTTRSSLPEITVNLNYQTRTITAYW